MALGQLPKFADNLYHDIEEDFWMVPDRRSAAHRHAHG